MEQLRWRRLDPLSFELVITPDHCPLVLDDPETEFYAADWLPQARTSHGIQLVLTLSPDELDAEMAFPDAATWCVSELGVRQEGYSHAGFRGSARELLRKAVEDIEQMRSAFPASVQREFDRFGDTVAAVQDGEGEVKLQIRDPSGLSAVRGEPLRWVRRSTFLRSWEDEDELGLISLKYPEVGQGDVATTAAEIAALLKRSKMVGVLTGAGVSVESGIPPFRSPPGHAVDGAIWGNFDASKMTNAQFNTSHSAAHGWWAVKRWLMPKILAADPNPAHHFFGELHRQGRLGVVVTQNLSLIHI
eukprot:TRINITY_DN5873_c0_g2_i9.p1 TRINITY_DN5873_c0_g2~~TRINITY_DN5873_c0_g2_i9.p1  ORF type:complete len:303 (-),score=65.37 TRINITY_DN5873_c0_g2_i9:172-1080(-)